MELTSSKLNRYLLVKLPLAYLAGIRVRELNSEFCKVTVKHKWINQNPFKSMYWAVQGMAAELATGALLLRIINTKNVRMSTLVTKNSAEYYKKATGRINFKCNSHQVILEAINKSLDNMESITIEIPANGYNEDGVEVSSFIFTWSIKPK